MELTKLIPSPTPPTMRISFASLISSGSKNLLIDSTKIEKHDYKYNITDKYGLEGGDIGVSADHLVLPAAPLSKPGADHYNPDSITGKHIERQSKISLYFKDNF